MFGDMDWISSRTDTQYRNYRQFLTQNGKKGITVIEIGAGSSVPTVRMAGEGLFGDGGRRTMVRVNTETEQKSYFLKRYEVINDRNIMEYEGRDPQNEFFEFNLSSRPAVEMIYKAIKDISYN